MVHDNARPVLVLEPGRSQRQYWRDMWAFRELLLQLARRDISVHYKQTVIGGLWALLRPAVTVAILWLVFHRVAKLEAPGGVWYPAFVLAGVVPWQLFATALAESSNSLVANATLVSGLGTPSRVSRERRTNRRVREGSAARQRGRSAPSSRSA